MFIAVILIVLYVLLAWILYQVCKGSEAWVKALKQRTRSLIKVGSVVFLLLTSVLFDRPVYYFPGLSGRVVDIETELPIKDAVVRVEVMEASYGSPAGPSLSSIIDKSVVTDADGRYRIRPTIRLRLWPFVALRSVDITAMHILTAKTVIYRDPIYFKPRTEDIELMSANQALLDLKAQKRLPGGVDTIWKAEFESIAKDLIDAGLSTETIKNYYSQYCATRISIFGSSIEVPKNYVLNGVY